MVSVHPLVWVLIRSLNVLHCGVGSRDKKAAIFHGAKTAKVCGRIGFTLQECEFMRKLVEICAQEFICRERAVLDSERKIFWLAQAEQWEQRAIDEIAFHFRECNLEKR